MRFICIFLCVISTASQAVERYSVNLMWLDFSPERDAKQFMSDENIDRVRGWRAKTGRAADVSLWYDGEHTFDEALSTTKAIFARDGAANQNLADVHFKNIRALPEVAENPDVFSTKTPGYFRADLTRVIAAYHGVENDREAVFVYADLDVAPMSKSELFDDETKENLRDFGIVLARGGHKGYENSFQMTAYKENLQKALKVALIDISIARAKNILEGGHWAYKKVNDTTPLTQTIYDTFDTNMFPYFYFLEGWADLELVFGAPHGVTLKDYLASEEARREFGIMEINRLRLANRSEKVTDSTESFLSDGRYHRENSMKIPTKIIDAPPSRFGGQPEKFDPEKITPVNFQEKLRQAEAPSFPTELLFIAARNNYLDDVKAIAAKLSAHEFADAMLEKSTKFGIRSRDRSTALHAAFVGGDVDTISFMLNKLGGRRDLLQRVGEAISASDNRNQTMLDNIPRKAAIPLMRLLVDTFPDNEELLLKIGVEILSFDDENYDLFERIVKVVPTLITEILPDGNMAALIATENGHLHTVRYILAHAPETFSIKNNNGEFPLLFVKELSPRVFREIWNASPSMHREKDHNFETIAHHYAREPDAEVMLRHALREAPDLFSTRSKHGSTPAMIAASSYQARHLDSIATALPDVVRQDLKEILNRCKDNYACLVVLAKHFKDKIDDIVAAAQNARQVRYSQEQIEKLRSEGR